MIASTYVFITFTYMHCTHIYYNDLLIKRVNIIRKSEKDGQHNDKKKKKG